MTRQCKDLFLGLPAVIFFLVDCNCTYTVESYCKNVFTSKSLNFTCEENKDNFLLCPLHDYLS